MMRCPHCEKQGISVLRKMILSPGLLATCHDCNEDSSVRYTPWLLAMIPGTILMIVALFMDVSSVEWTLNIIGFMLVLIIPLFYTPLAKEEPVHDGNQ
jgi:hypothetical protein